MKISVIGKNVEVTGALRNALEKKLSKLDRFFSPEVEAHVRLSVEKNSQIVEVTIPFNNVILRGEESNPDMYASIDLVTDKMLRQIRKQRTRIERRTHGTSMRYKSFLDGEHEDQNSDESKIVRTKKFAIKPMSDEEAVLQMELLGHNFFVYKNGDTGEVNVVYKRKDGNYGLIEPEY